MTGPGRADQFACTARVLDITPDTVIVSNLGIASYVLAGVEDRDRNFYQWGSMGVTTPTGLGLALATDEQVTVFDGDGSMLMSLGVLATVADQNPSNLTIIVWDNESYATTGGQDSHASDMDFVGAAQSCGLSATRTSTEMEFEEAYREAVASEHTEVIICKVETAEPESRPPYDYAFIKRRVREALTD